MKVKSAPATPRPKSGRPRGFDRAKALDKGLALFWQHGYDGVSISDLTAAIGIAAPSLYAAFTNKEEFYREALARYTELRGGSGGLPEGGTAFESVATALRGAVRALKTPGWPTGCLVSSGLLACSPAAGALAKEHRRLRALMQKQFRARITQGIAAGELPKTTDASSLARFYVTVMQGLSVQARDGTTAGELAQVVECALTAWPSVA